MPKAGLTLALSLLSGCSHHKPVPARLVAPPECVTILSPIPLTPDGTKILPHSHFEIRINCTKVILPENR